MPPAAASVCRAGVGDSLSLRLRVRVSGEALGRDDPNAIARVTRARSSTLKRQSAIAMSCKIPSARP